MDAQRQMWYEREKNSLKETERGGGREKMEKEHKVFNPTSVMVSAPRVDVKVQASTRQGMGRERKRTCVCMCVSPTRSLIRTGCYRQPDRKSVV